MSRRRQRLLTADERALWDEVRKTMSHKSVAPSNLIPELAPVSPPEVSQPRQVELTRLSGFSLRANQPSSTHFSAAPDPANAPGVSQLDRRTMARLRTGRERPQARLDLHGMFLNEAHDALQGFIRRSYADGKKMVLVITGKGKPVEDRFHHTPHRRGVLRHALPQWLASPALAPIILQVTPAQDRDGGAGAWYIWLRRAGK